MGSPLSPLQPGFTSCFLYLCASDSCPSDSLAVLLYSKPWIFLGAGHRRWQNSKFRLAHPGFSVFRFFRFSLLFFCFCFDSRRIGRDANTPQGLSSSRNKDVLVYPVSACVPKHRARSQETGRVQAEQENLNKTKHRRQRECLPILVKR